MYSYGPPHMAVQKQDDQDEHTFSSYVRIRDVVLKTCLGRWTIGRSGERGSGISVLPARHDDTYIYIYVCVCVCVFEFTRQELVYQLRLVWHKATGIEHFTRIEPPSNSLLVRLPNTLWKALFLTKYTMLLFSGHKTQRIFFWGGWREGGENSIFSM